MTPFFSTRQWSGYALKTTPVRSKPLREKSLRSAQETQKVKGHSIEMRSRIPDHARVYRLRFNTPDPLLLINCTVWLAPCTTMWITPEIEYSLL